MKKQRLIWITLIYSIIVAILELSTFKDSQDITRISIYLAVYASYFAIELKQHFEEVSSYIKNPLKGIDGMACIVHLREEDFYLRFGEVIWREAEQRVCISYIHTSPPSDLIQGSSKRNYYESLFRIVEKRANVAFRRLILAAPENLDWIHDIANDFEGLGNFNLSVLLPAQAKGYATPISVQCVDYKYTFLVAVATQKETGAHRRDIMIADKETTDKFARYYQDTFDAALPILAEGVLQQDNLDSLKRIA